MIFDENNPKNHTLSEPVHAGVILSRLLSKGQIGEKNDLVRLQENFEKLFGKNLALHLKLVDFQDSILFLKAANSVWKSEILYQKKAIIDVCNGLLGAARVREIRLI